MSNELKILDQAIRCVSEEKSSFQTECEAFRTFRDTVSRTRPTNSGDTDSGTGATQLLETYQETVMSTPGYEATYGDSLADSLTAELPPSSANTLLSENRISHQQKRNLLLAINDTIQQRERLIEILETELKALQEIRTEVADIEATLKALPPCSIQRLSFEKYVEVWDICDAQLQRCDRHLQNRQVAVTEAQQPVIPPGDSAYAFNEYLYHNLETSYPALRAIAETRQSIVQYRGKKNGPVDRTAK